MRTDGDTWDIVTSVGRTALGVAAFRAVETNRADRIIRDDYARLFIEAAGDQHFSDMLADPSSIDDRNMVSQIMGPRTRFFDEYFETATAAGVRQAVILAAGLDARAFRLNWPAGTTVFEIDQAGVLEFKDRVLTEHGAQPTTERRTVPVDLRDDWPAALNAAGFDPNAPSAWSAEGLLSFLPGAAQDALFERIDAASVPGSQVASHVMFAGADAQKLREAALKYFDRAPFGADSNPADLWYQDERADPITWLGEHNWTVHAHTIHDLADGYGRQLSLPADAPAEIVELRKRTQFWTAVKS